jgi:hypothetical protein
MSPASLHSLLSTTSKSVVSQPVGRFSLHYIEAITRACTVKDLDDAQNLLDIRNNILLATIIALIAIPEADLTIPTSRFLILPLAHDLKQRHRRSPPQTEKMFSSSSLSVVLS